ncbi:MAG: S8 family peptidase [Flavobacteriales bacterium]|nr:S8 family peptidase [Flavobacteriales bacterium]
MEYQPCSGPYLNFGVSPWLISGNSSAGPTRDDRWKPDIAAPGDITMAAAPMPILADWAVTNADKLDEFCMHARNGGTSMASPVVAGIAALYLQKCPSADWQQVRNAILNTAWGDGITGTLPNKYFGYGRVHAFDALTSSNLPGITITASDDEMCANASVTAMAPSGYAHYWWSNGSISNPAAYTGPGPLTVNASNGTGCAQSNALSFTVLPVPPTPVITVDGSLLTSSAGPSYQWYLNGLPIEFATGPTWWAVATGTYTVEHVAANGCSAFSTPVELLSVGVDAHASAAGFAVWPSPTSGDIMVQLPSGFAGGATVQVVDASGRMKWNGRLASGVQFALPASDWSAGTYTVLVTAGNRRWNTRIVRLP